MSTYAIGDIQGCYQPLLELLEKINFDKNKDTLWFTGDLVNRGPQSLETVRLIQSLGNKAITVLGNHDLTLLAVANNTIPYNPAKHTFNDILQANDCDEIIHWFKHLPLIHHEKEFTLVHAGLHPQWDHNLALILAREVEHTLQSKNCNEFLNHLFGNEPNFWDETLTGWARLRFITNCLTRIRFCSATGKLDLMTKESLHNAPEGYYPWFQVPNRKNENLKIIFGHWAALEGQTGNPNAIALDTGCVWGKCLTAFRLEDNKRFSVPCSKNPP